MNTLKAMLRGRQFGYLVALTLLVLALGTAGIVVFERDQPEATINNVGDALWWSACVITTINNEKYAVSPEGRVLAVLLRIYAVAIFGLLTANIASYVVGRRQEERAALSRDPDEATLALHEEVRQLRADLRVFSAGIAPSSVGAEATSHGSSSDGVRSGGGDAMGTTTNE